MAADEDSLRWQLTAIKDKTSSAETLKLGGWWVGDVAGERQVRDDLAAGRLEWRAAWNSARSGLKALDQGDLVKAGVWLANARSHYISVLEKRVRSQDMEILSRPSKKRCRTKK
jgi:hypothetical protein